ncbi:MAG: hypothetical protein KF891_11635 [Rhizobacter sp.]|nr:hypothetical protein [Rhizobacter sp.]
MMGAATRPKPQAAAPIHPADLSYEWSQESLFGRLSRRALHQPATRDIFASELGGLWPAGNPLSALYTATTLHGGRAIEELQRYLGPLGATNFDRLVGADLTGSGETSPRIPREHRVLTGGLRSCSICLQHGYHSMLFQHLAVDRCPGHGMPLQEGCPSCRAPLLPTFESTLCRPFECTKCGALLLKTAVGKDAVQQMQMTNLLVADWRRDLAFQFERGEIRASSSSFDVDALYERPVNAQRRRRLHRMCAWPLVSSQRWTSFRRVERLYHVTELRHEPFKRDEASLGTNLANEARKTLLWLVAQCEAYKKQSFDLISIAWCQPQFIIPTGERQNAAIPVALHATMCQYGMNFNTRPDRELRSSDVPYKGVCWNGFSAQRFPLDAGEHVGMLLAHEILGYFAIALRRYASPTEYSFHDVMPVGRFSPSAYCAPWRLVRSGKCLSLEVRPRATQAFVQRLIRRYAKVPLGSLVRCDPVAGSPSGMVWVRTRWSPRMPLELLHFPAGKACTADRARHLWEEP